MIEIDGSQKSGSGTILRDALAYAILLQEQLHIRNVRARRQKPGLRPQHLKVLEAAAQLSKASVEGGFVGSNEIYFTPQSKIRGGEFHWDIGTAGSVVMLAHSLLPVALFAEETSLYILTGGLFQDFAPSAYHFSFVLLPLLRSMGVEAEAKILRPGYVPRGGGEIEVTIQPAKKNLVSLTSLTQGRIVGIEGYALSSHLQGRAVSWRMARAFQNVLKETEHRVTIEILYDMSAKPYYDKPSLQPGAALAVWAQTDKGCLIGSDMAGARNRTSEQIGSKVATDLIEDLTSGATVDRHLADQLIPFAALAKGESSYLVPHMTDHIEARLWLAERILGATTSVSGNRVTIEGTGRRSTDYYYSCHE
jgi:RNA 3'-terminal phosphate cyclase (ATP)